MKEKTARVCYICNKGFKPMTDKQWEIIYNNLHKPMSIRHQKYLALKST